MSGACSSQEKNITNIIVVIITVVLLCHTPDRVLTVFKAILKPENKHCPDPLIYASHFCNLLIVVNSSANFVVYCIYRRRFRRILLSLVCRCPCVSDDWRPDFAVTPEQTSLRSWPGSLQGRRGTRKSADGTNGRISDASATRRLTSNAACKRKPPSDSSVSETAAIVTFHVGPETLS